MSQRGFSLARIHGGARDQRALAFDRHPLVRGDEDVDELPERRAGAAMVLARARWSAINSARDETRVAIEGSVVRVRAGAAVDSPSLPS